MTLPELKKGTFYSAELGREVELLELSYRGQTEAFSAYVDNPSMAAPTLIHYGVPEFSELEVAEIADKFPLNLVVELADAVTAFSGLDVDGEDAQKKSERAPTSDSSTH